MCYAVYIYSDTWLVKNHVIKNSTWHRYFFASYICHILQTFASHICHPLGQELKSCKALKNDNPSGLVFIAPFLYIQHSEQRHLISGVGKCYMLNECIAHHVFNQSKLYKAYICEHWKLKLKTYKRELILPHYPKKQQTNGVHLAGTKGIQQRNGHDAKYFLRPIMIPNKHSLCVNKVLIPNQKG